MKKGRFTEEQIIGVLKQHEAGRKVPELAREIGVSDATIYTWKSKYGGMDVSEAQLHPGSTRSEPEQLERWPIVDPKRANGSRHDCNKKGIAPSSLVDRETAIAAALKSPDFKTKKAVYRTSPYELTRQVLPFRQTLAKSRKKIIVCSCQHFLFRPEDFSFPQTSRCISCDMHESRLLFRNTENFLVASFR
jgi:putative transposase